MVSARASGSASVPELLSGDSLLPAAARADTGVPDRMERVRATEPGADPVGVDDRGGFRTGDEDGDVDSVDDILPTPPAGGFLVAADMARKILLCWNRLRFDSL